MVKAGVNEGVAIAVANRTGDRMQKKRRLKDHYDRKE